MLPPGWPALPDAARSVQGFGGLCEEMGIATGIDMDALLEAGHLAETILGRRLPSSLLRSGSLAQFRRNAA